jgi:hypothetical protein
MSRTPEQTQRLTVRIMMAMGLGIFLLMAGIGAWQYNHKKNLAATATPVTLNVAEVLKLCSVERKANKNWSSTGVYACDEAKRIVAEKNGITAWRSVEGDYAVVTWDANGQSYREQYPVSRISEAQLQPGMQLQAYADPADPTSIERPFSEADWSNFKFMTALGAGIGSFAALIGVWAANWNQRIQERGLAAGGAIGADGRIVYPESDATGRAVELVTPAWARYTVYLARAVLVLGTLLAVLAAAGGLMKSDVAAVQGAFTIFVLSLMVWKLLHYIASFGPRPAERS